MSAPLPSLYGTVFNLIDTKSILHLGSMLGGGGQKGGYPFYFDNAEKLGLSRKKYLTLEKSKPKGMKMKTWIQMNQKKKKPKRSKKKATKKRRQRGIGSARRTAYGGAGEPSQTRRRPAPPPPAKSVRRMMRKYPNAGEREILAALDSAARVMAAKDHPSQRVNKAKGLKKLSALRYYFKPTRPRASIERIAGDFLTGRKDWRGIHKAPSADPRKGGLQGNIISSTRISDKYGQILKNPLPPVDISSEMDRKEAKKILRERGIFFDKGEPLDALIRKIKAYNETGPSQAPISLDLNVDEIFYLLNEIPLEEAQDACDEIGIDVDEGDSVEELRTRLCDHYGIPQQWGAAPSNTLATHQDGGDPPPENSRRIRRTKRVSEPTAKRSSHPKKKRKYKRTTRARPGKQKPRKKQTKSKSFKIHASKFFNNNSSPIGGLLYSSV